MTYAEAARALGRLGLRHSIVDGGQHLWVNPRSGASVVLAERSGEESSVAQLMPALEKLGISWKEFEAASET